MAADEELHGLAGEYVLGTLSAAERQDAQSLIKTDAGFAAAVRTWENRLTPLSLAAGPIAPPPRVREAVLRRVAGDQSRPSDSNVVSLRRQVSRWRGIAMGTSVLASGLAAALAAFVILQPPPPSTQGRFVAVLQPGEAGPAFVASIDLAAGTISVRPVAAQPQPGKSYELWALGGGRDKPQSLGLIDAGLKIEARELGPADPAALGETVFAVSLEPQGGSPTGQPTGPVLYTGRLVATE